MSAPVALMRRNFVAALRIVVSKPSAVASASMRNFTSSSGSVSTWLAKVVVPSMNQAGAKRPLRLHSASMTFASTEAPARPACVSASL